MKETDMLIILLTMAILVVVGIMFAIYTLFIKKKSELLIKLQHDELEFQKQLSFAEIEIKEQTLTYMGQELHDDLGQKLSVAKMMVNQLLTTEDSKQNHILQELNTIMGESIQDVRSLSKTLITDNVLQFGIVDSLEKEIERIKKLNHLEIVFYINRHDVDINPKHGLILFRVIQELINNTLKHSNAKIMKIMIQDSEKRLEVHLEDDGVGFNIEESKNGSGLKNIINRTKVINATCVVASEPSKGTNVRIKYKKQ